MAHDGLNVLLADSQLFILFGLVFADLSKHPVQSVADCERLMDRGWRNRAVGATLMNAESSR